MEINPELIDPITETIVREKIIIDTIISKNEKLLFFM
jgi:hypothetical protein